MPTSVPLVFHERLSHWYRALRHQVSTWPVRVHESRTGHDLEALLRPMACPVLVLDLGRRTAQALEDLHLARSIARDALILAIDTARRPEVPPIALDLGATLVMGGPVVPPQVLAILGRWVPLARQRAGRGWSPEDDPTPLTPDGLIDQILKDRTLAGR